MELLECFTYNKLQHVHSPLGFTGTRNYFSVQFHHNFMYNAMRHFTTDIEEEHTNEDQKAKCSCERIFQK